MSVSVRMCVGACAHVCVCVRACVRARVIKPKYSYTFSTQDKYSLFST